jgi:hypothetical protein
MYKVIIYLISIGAINSVSGQAIYLPSVSKASFGDGFKSEKYKTSYYSNYHDQDNLSGVEFGRHRFGLGLWDTKGEQLSYIGKETDTEDGTVKNLNVGYNTLDASKTILTADGNFAQWLSPALKGEIALNRDRVEVQSALVSSVLANSVNFSLEHHVLEPMRVQWTLGETRYTDGNHRPVFKMKAVYDALPRQGVNLQLRSRYFKNTDTHVTSGYFNPYRFVESIAAVEVNRVVNGWDISGNIGYGRQAGGDDAKTLAKAFEFSASLPLSQRMYLKTKAGYFRSLGVGGPDFIFRYISEDVVVQF